MILCYGEILVDFIGSSKGGVFSYERYAGGAPFNVACAATRAGGKSGFVGAVGDDLIGTFLTAFAKVQKLKRAEIARLSDCNTTLAFVELDARGERSFCFYRKNTADFKIPDSTLAFVNKADIVHLGSLMLSESVGVAFAEKLVDAVRKAGKKLSFDINYRDDIFPDKEEAKKVYSRFIDAADIVKYSLDELELFTGKSGLDGLNDVAKKDKLVCVTLGGEGSAYAIGDKTGIVPSVPVTVVDTTGAGDAFYGALLSKLDGKNFSALSDKDLKEMFRFANIAGAVATTGRGAIDSLPDKKDIERFAAKYPYSAK